MFDRPLTRDEERSRQLIEIFDHASMQLRGDVRRFMLQLLLEALIEDKDPGEITLELKCDTRKEGTVCHLKLEDIVCPPPTV